MKIQAVWEFDVDDSWDETEEQCIEIARTEFNAVTADDVEFRVIDKFNYPYSTVN